MAGKLAGLRIPKAVENPSSNGETLVTEEYQKASHILTKHEMFIMTFVLSAFILASDVSSLYFEHDQFELIHK